MHTVVLKNMPCIDTDSDRAMTQHKIRLVKVLQQNGLVCLATNCIIHFKVK